MPMSIYTNVRRATGRDGNKASFENLEGPERQALFENDSPTYHAMLDDWRSRGKPAAQRPARTTALLPRAARPPVHAGKTYAQMTFVERGRLSEVDPGKYGTMREAFLAELSANVGVGDAAAEQPEGSLGGPFDAPTQAARARVVAAMPAVRDQRQRASGMFPLSEAYLISLGFSSREEAESSGLPCG